MPVILSAVISALIAFVPSSVAAQRLPDASGKDVMVRICGACHEAQRSASVRLTREGWQEVIARMVSIGAKGTEDELAQVLEYLAQNFKGDAPRPLNLNKATAVELESVGGLLRREAAAWIAYREKAGPCKSLEDFKKVPGVPYKKIAARRDRLVCF